MTLSERARFILSISMCITYMSFIQQADEDPLLVSIDLDLADIVGHRRHDDDLEEKECSLPFLQGHEDHGPVKKVKQVVTVF